MIVEDTGFSQRAVSTPWIGPLVRLVTGVATAVRVLAAVLVRPGTAAAANYWNNRGERGRERDRDREREREREGTDGRKREKGTERGGRERGRKEREREGGKRGRQEEKE